MDQYALNLYPHLAEAKINAEKAVINLKIWKAGTQVRSNEEAYGRLSPTVMALECVVKGLKKTVKEFAGILGDNKHTVEAIDIIKQKADEMAMIALDLEATADICIRRLTFQDIEGDQDLEDGGGGVINGNG